MKCFTSNVHFLRHVAGAKWVDETSLEQQAPVLDNLRQLNVYKDSLSGFLVTTVTTTSYPTFGHFRQLGHVVCFFVEQEVEVELGLLVRLLFGEVFSLLAFSKYLLNKAMVRFVYMTIWKMRTSNLTDSKSVHLSSSSTSFSSNWGCFSLKPSTPKSTP